MQAYNLIEVEDIHRSLSLGERSLQILRGVTFSVGIGEWVALTGPSGSGKSTLLGILAGIDRPTRGRVLLEGIEISARPEGQLAKLRNEKIGVVFQAFHLIPTMTALENVEAPLYINPKWKQARSLAQQMLEQLGLGERLHHLPHQLSGGEQQRVALARALACHPALLLADEPTGNLDSATSRQVLGLIRLLREQLGLTVMVVTHDAQVASYADRSLRLVDGQLVDGSQLAFPGHADGVKLPGGAQA